MRTARKAPSFVGMGVGNGMKVGESALRVQGRAMRENPVTPENEEFGIDNHSDSVEDLCKHEALGPDGFWL